MLMVAANVATVVMRSEKRDLIKAATTGPDAPTNNEIKPVIRPPQASPALPNTSCGSFGPQVRYNKNNAIHSCSKGAGNCTNKRLPTVVPSNPKGTNQATVNQSMWRQASTVRPTLDPICTTPCTGIIAGAGNTSASMAINTAPPPAPAIAVNNEVLAESNTKPQNIQSLAGIEQNSSNGYNPRDFNAPDLRSGQLKKVVFLCLFARHCINLSNSTTLNNFVSLCIKL